MALKAANKKEEVEMNEHSKQSVTKEIDLAKLFWAICRKWKSILLWMVAIAIVGGAAKVGRSALSMRDSDEVSLALSAYKMLVANNLQERIDCRHRMENLSLELKEQQEYVDNSRYMHIDPYNVAVAKATYYVKTDYEIMPEMTYQNRDYTDMIVNTYMEILTSESNLLVVCDKIDMELRYLQEIMSVWSDGYGTLSIQVISDSLEDSEKILRLLDDCVTNNKEKITATIDDHRIGQLTDSAYTTADLGMAQTQQAKKDMLTELRTQFSDEQERYKALTKESAQIEEPTYTVSAILKESIKAMIIGAILGAVIACCVIFSQVVISDNVYSADCLAERTRMRILGALPGDVKKIEKMSKLDLLLRRKEGLSTTTDTASGYSVAASYLAGICPNASTILVAGGAETEYIKNACEMFQAALSGKSFMNGDYILSDANTIRMVGQCDAVVLVEQAGVSRYTEVLKEIEVIQNLKGTIVGAVMIEN